MVTPMPIILPMSSGGGDITLAQVGICLTAILLFFQYVFLVLEVIIGGGDYFKNKLHAIAWIIPGWPIFELAYIFITNFWRL